LSLKHFFVFSFLLHAVIIASVLLFPLQDRNGEDIQESLLARLVSPAEIYTQPPRVSSLRGRRQPPPVFPPSTVAPSMPSTAIPAPPQTAYSPAPVIPRVTPKPVVPSPQPYRESKEKTVRVKQEPHNESKLADSEKNKSLPAPAPVPPSAKADSEKFQRPAQDNVSKESRESVPKPDNPKPSIKEKLFDRNVINDLAKRDMGKKEQAKKDKIPLLDTRPEQTYGFKGGLQNRDDKKFEADKKLSFDGKDLKFMLYDRKLKERIEHIWIYPPSAAARGISGDLVIRFTIMKNGKLGAVELIRTSGHKDLDDAAIKALKDASPFWPLPESWGMDSYTIDGHFIYSIIYNI
jgi:periplasmic protein TonB